MNNPLVSIIIPTFNRIDLFEETINSVLNQTYQNWECIIVDDGSSEINIGKLLSYKNKSERIIFLQRNRLPSGVSTCRNIGVEKALGDFVIFLDSDDILHPECLSNRVSFAQDYPGKDFWVFCAKEFKDNIHEQNVIHNKYPKNEGSSEYLKMFIRGVIPFCVMAPIWKKECLYKPIIFNEKLSIWEDPEFHIRLISSGLKFKVFKNLDPDCYYRKNSRSKKEFSENKQYFKRVLENKYVFYREIISIHSLGESIIQSYKKEFKENVLYFIEEYLIKYYSIRFFFVFINLFYKEKVINFREIKKLLILLMIRILRVDRYEGIGSWRIKRFIKTKRKQLYAKS